MKHLNGSSTVSVGIVLMMALFVIMVVRGGEQPRYDEQKDFALKLFATDKYDKAQVKEIMALPRFPEFDWDKMKIVGGEMVLTEGDRAVIVSVDSACCVKVIEELFNHEGKLK